MTEYAVQKKDHRGHWVLVGTGPGGLNDTIETYRDWRESAPHIQVRMVCRAVTPWEPVDSESLPDADNVVEREGS